MRYIIRDLRPGTTLHTPDGFVSTNNVDAGATLTKAQLAYLRDCGYKIDPTKEPAPAPKESAEDPDTAADAELERQQTAREIKRSTRDALAPLRKKTHDPRRR